MLMDAMQISRAIREKKKRMLEADPEIVDTSPKPDMDAQDVYDLNQQGRIEETLDVPHKINADDTNMDMSYQGVGVSPEEKARMPRLRKYIDSLNLG